ncbi:hypothetical protein GGR51DRAFT_570044 [Nemania sp. FL0031]|nr:hypothetical protein GGR51DRAFT_570044 [Nemania sp. FL0031]
MASGRYHFRSSSVRSVPLLNQNVPGPYCPSRVLEPWEFKRLDNIDIAWPISKKAKEMNYSPVWNSPVSLKYQFNWAVKLTLAVLKFHSTPWLRDSWRTNDLFLPTLELSMTEKPSLFLKTDLVSKRSIDKSLADSSEVDAIMTGQDTTAAHIVMSEDYDEYHYGINNQTLWALGIALLEIAHWAPLDSLKPEGHIDDVVAVRGVAKRKTLLGAPYEAIVRKCLQCNFGCGTNLCRAELQVAVYNSVVCPLQDTIEKLEKMGL